MSASPDFTTILKIIEAISSEKGVDDILHRYLRILIHELRADKGFILEKLQGDWYLKSEEGFEYAENNFEGGIPVVDERLPLKLINHVSSLNEPLILDNGQAESLDPYFMREGKHAVYCIPLKRNKYFEFIAYLERKDLENPFHPQEVDWVNRVSPQLLILLEQTKKIENLETSLDLLTEKDQGTLGNFENIRTQLESVQKKLLEADRMIALGQLTTGIAHEINNPVNFIASNIDSLRLDFEDLKRIIDKYEKIENLSQLQEAHTFASEMDMGFIFKEIEGLIQGIEEGSKRTKNIVFGLRSYSRSDKDEYALADVHEGLDTTLVLLGNKLREKIIVEKKYGNLPLVECVIGKINQVFMNILNNAIQAMPGGGKILIITERLEENISISIRDNGQGIPEEVQKKIFEPFFTTKAVGEGTGLGLSISNDIIKKHKGKIEVSSEPDNGSTFSILLPIRREN